MVERNQGSQAINLPSGSHRGLAAPVRLSDVVAANGRLEASAYGIEARAAVEALRTIGEQLVPLFGEQGLAREAHNAFHFRRIWTGPQHGVPFLSSSDIIAMRPERGQYISGKLTRGIEKLIVQLWDVLVSCSGTVGNVALAGKSLAGYALSQDAIRIRFADAETSGYAAAFLRSKFGRPQVVGASYGSVIVHIEPEHLRSILIPNLHPIRRTSIGLLMREATELRDHANALMDQADRLLHERLNLASLGSLSSIGAKGATAPVLASALVGRFDASYHAPQAEYAEKKVRAMNFQVLNLGDQRVCHEIRAITRFRKRVYVEAGGIPMLSSKQLQQVDPIDIKRLAKGAHAKDLAEIALEENMCTVSCSGTIGRIQIIPRYMEGWTANQHATRLVAAPSFNPGYIFAWLASDYGQVLIRRHSYGSVILEVDKNMLGSIPIPIPSAKIVDEIGDLVLKANAQRNQAWLKEREGIGMFERFVTGEPNPVNA